MMRSAFDSSYARLSMQGSLIGEAGPNLLGACIYVRLDEIVVTYYVASGISAIERQGLSTSSALVAGGFPRRFRMDMKIIDVRDAALQLPQVGDWVWLQRGFLEGSGRFESRSRV